MCSEFAFVVHAFRPRRTIRHASHLLAERRKSSLHLGSELDDLRFDSRQPGGHVAQLFHVFFEDFDSAFETHVHVSAALQF